MVQVSKRLLITALFWLTATCVALASGDPAKAFSEGNRLYGEEKYDKAIAAFLEITAMGYVSEDLYYNLGNAYYKSGDYPNAILYYERALKLSPADPDITYNLKMANLHTIDKIEPMPKLFYEKWADEVVYGASISKRAWTGILLLWAAVLMASLYLFASRVAVRKISFLSSAVMLVAALITLGLTWKQYDHLNTQKEAVIFSESVYIKSSPDDKSANLFMLHSGTKVKVLDELKGWKKVRIANGNEGWIGISDIKGI